MPSSAAAVVIAVAVLTPARGAFAWEAAGHALVGQTASYLLGRDAQFLLLRRNATALGHYNQVPDIAWKGDERHRTEEKTEHWIELERFGADLGSRPEDASRELYFAAHPEIDIRAGRAPWRIAELDARLGVLAQSARDANDAAARRAAQDEWLVVAGVLGHYVADLGMPLHTSSNYDGHLTGQPGLHRYIERDVVDVLMPSPLSEQVWRRVVERWPSFRREHQGRDAFSLALELARDTHRHIPALIQLDRAGSEKDRAVARSDVAAAAARMCPLIVDRLATATLFLAVIWEQRLTWPVNDTDHDLVPAPRFIPPGGLRSEGEARRTEPMPL